MKLPLDLFPHPRLDNEDPRISPDAYSSLVHHALSLCCSCSLFVPSLTAQLDLYVPSCLPTAPACPRSNLPVALQTRTPTVPRSHHVTNAVSAIGRLELSSLAPAPHRSLTRQTFIVRHIHVHLIAEVRLLSQTYPVAVARATLCPLRQQGE